MKHCGSYREAGHTVAEMYFAPVSLTEVSSSDGGTIRNRTQDATSSAPPVDDAVGSKCFRLLPVRIHTVAGRGGVCSGETSRNISGHAFLSCHLSLELKCNMASYFGSIVHLYFDLF